MTQKEPEAHITKLHGAEIPVAPRREEGENKPVDDSLPEVGAAAVEPTLDSVKLPTESAKPPTDSIAQKSTPSSE